MEVVLLVERRLVLAVLLNRDDLDGAMIGEVREELLLVQRDVPTSESSTVFSRGANHSSVAPSAVLRRLWFPVCRCRSRTGRYHRS